MKIQPKLINFMKRVNISETEYAETSEMSETHNFQFYTSFRFGNFLPCLNNCWEKESSFALALLPPKEKDNN